MKICITLKEQFEIKKKAYKQEKKELKERLKSLQSDLNNVKNESFTEEVKSKKIGNCTTPGCYGLGNIDSTKETLCYKFMSNKFNQRI